MAPYIGSSRTAAAPRPSLSVTGYTVPASLAALGFVTPQQARRVAGQRNRRLMIATEGEPDSGKTEFGFSFPGPGAVLACDRGFDAMLDNQTPPPTRRSDFAMRVCKMPSATDFSNPRDYAVYWLEYLKVMAALRAEQGLTTIMIDGDNITWECQRLAEHGKLTGVFPQTKYTDVYAARRAFYFKLWDCGKIILATNMMRNEFKNVVDANGNVVLDPATGEPKKEPTGQRIAQGFPDQDYLWQIRLRHLFQPGTPATFNSILRRMVPGTAPQWGVRILKCKANMSLVGQELWGDQCNFTGLVSLVYPHVPLSEWGL